MSTDTHVLVTVELLDVPTGRRAAVDCVSAWEWAEGNYSCDCNRSRFFEGARDEIVAGGAAEGFCYGCRRVLVVAADTDLYTLDEFNEGYPEELRRQYLPPAETRR